MMQQLFESPLPGHIKQLIDYVEILLDLHDDMPFLAVDRDVFRRELWERVFTQLIRRKDEGFSATLFMERILKWVATRHSLNYSILLDELIFRLALFQHSTTETTLLTELLITLKQSSSISALSIVPQSTASVSNAPCIDIAGTDTPFEDRLAVPQEIRRWLAFGIWPSAVPNPNESAVTRWLENQTNEDWLEALKGCDQPEEATQRIASHLSYAFFERLIYLQACQEAPSILEFVRLLNLAGKQLASPTAYSSLTNDSRKYVLAYLLNVNARPDAQTLSMPTLLRYTLQILSLTWRVPYEQLLTTLQQISSQDGIQSPHRKLSEILKTFTQTSAHTGELTVSNTAPRFFSTTPRSSSAVVEQACSRPAQQPSQQTMFLGHSVYPWTYSDPISRITAWSCIAAPDRGAA